MNILTIWICVFKSWFMSELGLQSKGILSYTQHFLSDEVMSWRDADSVCPNLFYPGSGVVHMAGNLTSNPEQIQVLRTLKNQESFWLDGIRFHLGCKEKSCEYLRVQHRLGAESLKFICIEDGQLKISSACNTMYNLTSVTDQSKLLNMSDYVNGEELRVKQADIQGVLKQCRLATRTPGGFRIQYQSCTDAHKVLCQKHSDDNPLVTSLIYQRTDNGDDTAENVDVWMTSSTEAYDTKEVWDVKWLITTSVSGLSCIFSVIICIYLGCRKRTMVRDGSGGGSGPIGSQRRRHYDDTMIIDPYSGD